MYELISETIHSWGDFSLRDPAGSETIPGHQVHDNPNPGGG